MLFEIALFLIDRIDRIRLLKDDMWADVFWNVIA